MSKRITVNDLVVKLLEQNQSDTIIAEDDPTDEEREFRKIKDKICRTIMGMVEIIFLYNILSYVAHKEHTVVFWFLYVAFVAASLLYEWWL